jgi:hypothetical protein
MAAEQSTAFASRRQPPARRYPTADELATTDWKAVDSTHPLWGRYLRPPLGEQPEVAQYLDDIGVDQEEFCHWLDDCLFLPTAFTLWRHRGPAKGLLDIARVFVQHRHEGRQSLNAAAQAMLAIRGAKARTSRA